MKMKRFGVIGCLLVITLAVANMARVQHSPSEPNAVNFLPRVEENAGLGRRVYELLPMMRAKPKWIAQGDRNCVQTDQGEEIVFHWNNGRGMITVEMPGGGSRVTEEKYRCLNGDLFIIEMKGERLVCGVYRQGSPI